MQREEKLRCLHSIGRYGVRLCQPLDARRRRINVVAADLAEQYLPLVKECQYLGMTCADERLVKCLDGISGQWCVGTEVASEVIGCERLSSLPKIKQCPEKPFGGVR